MCGRYTILPDARAWILGWGLARDTLGEAGWQASYNIAPGAWVPIVRGTAAGRGLVIDRALWGYVPHWVKEDKPRLQPINARADSVAGKPYFREAFRHRRCLFPASGFYEWRSGPRGKQPYLVQMADGSPFFMGGIWDTWRGDDTAAIITTDANSLMAPIHPRMPLIIAPDEAQRWVLGDEPEPLLRPFDAEGMRAYPVSRAVNNPQHDAPDLIAMVSDEEPLH